MNIELIFASPRPGESICIEQSRVSRQGIGQHESSVEENDTLSIADRSRKRPKASKKGRRSHERPSVDQRVIDGALICPDRVEDPVGEVIFAALDDDAAIGENG